MEIFNLPIDSFSPFSLFLPSKPPVALGRNEQVPTGPV